LAAVLTPRELDQRKKRVRRTAILFALIAAAFYFSFIIMSVVRASKL
jgi:hypothetical protein